MNPKNLIGDRIRLLRELKGWTQEKFAKKLCASGCPITRNIVARWETRGTTVSDIRLPGIAALFGSQSPTCFHRHGAVANGNFD